MRITRVGSPEPLTALDDVYRLAVRLSEPVSLAWWRLFREVGEGTSTCHPKMVSLTEDHRGLVFEAGANDVTMWIAYIDRWITCATAEIGVEWKRERAEARARAEASPDTDLLRFVAARLSTLTVNGETDGAPTAEPR